MKAYVIVTGTVFGLVTLAHLWRLVVEHHLVANAFFMVITLVAASLALWAGRLVWQSRRR